MRRALHDTIVALVETAAPAAGNAAGLTLRSVALDVPIEFQLQRRSDEWEVLGDLPRWRWRTGFDPAPGRLVFEVSQEGAR